MVDDVSNYYSKIEDAKNYIGTFTEEKIIKLNIDKFVEDFFEKKYLPEIEIDEKKPCKTRKIKVIRVFKDDMGDFLTLNRYHIVTGSIFVKPKKNLKETLKKTAIVENQRIFTSQFEFLCNGEWNYKKGKIQFKCHSEDEAQKIINDFKIFNEIRNRRISQSTDNFKTFLMDYIKDLKKALNEEKKGRTCKPKMKQNDDSWDYDDEDYVRCPNDDRSDSLNPNNPAYQASLDNRSNQLNPNNSRYRGK